MTDEHEGSLAFNQPPRHHAGGGAGLKGNERFAPRVVTRRLIRARALLLLVAAFMLLGCEERMRDEVVEAWEDVSEQPGEATAAYPDEVEAKELPVLDAAGITALRDQAAADGKVLVIDCWATWCGSCVQMFPKLHAAMKQRGDKVKLVSLCYDEGEDYVQKAKQFLTKRDAWDGAYLAVAGDAKDELPTAMSEEWDGGALPAVFVYKPDGTLAYEMLQTEGDVDEWVANIAAAADKAAGE